MRGRSCFDYQGSNYNSDHTKLNSGKIAILKYGKLSIDELALPNACQLLHVTFKQLVSNNTR